MSYVKTVLWQVFGRWCTSHCSWYSWRQPAPASCQASHVKYSLCMPFYHVGGCTRYFVLRSTDFSQVMKNNTMAGILVCEYSITKEWVCCSLDLLKSPVIDSRQSSFVTLPFCLLNSISTEPAVNHLNSLCNEKELFLSSLTQRLSVLSYSMSSCKRNATLSKPKGQKFQETQIREAIANKLFFKNVQSDPEWRHLIWIINKVL